jgi:hypothetical protein
LDLYNNSPLTPKGGIKEQQKFKNSNLKSELGSLPFGEGWGGAYGKF